MARASNRCAGRLASTPGSPAASLPADGGLTGRRRLRAPRPVLSERARTLALGEEIRVVRDDARPEVLRRVGRLGPEGGVPLRLARDLEPPPGRAWRCRRRCAAAGERTAVVFELQEVHRYS